MKPFLLFLILFVGTGAPSGSTTTVYVCGNNGAKSYHLKSNCRGLSSCSHKIVKTTLEKAKQDGLTKCGWEK